MSNPTAGSERTLAILKPDTFWRGLDAAVEARFRALDLKVIGELKLAGAANLTEERWREFYFPAIGNRPACILGTSKYMAYGPVKVLVFEGIDAIQKIRRANGATRPWQAEPGTIRGDYWAGADAANASYRVKFQQPGDEQFLFNMVHASDSTESFNREVKFFPAIKF
ncbi:MAG TPA: nucleoside-diphosphate kinase [Verrucomicrobiae bacterium]